MSACSAVENDNDNDDDDTLKNTDIFLPEKGPPLVSLHPATGRLRYRTYAPAEYDQQPQQAVHYIPDFSFAGYRGGGVAIPEYVPAVEIIDGPVVVKTNNNGEDDDDTASNNNCCCWSLIQDAIHRVEARPLDEETGFRGAILVRRGVYHVSKTLVISKSGVILRGEGQGPHDTRLVATATTQICFVKLSGVGLPAHADFEKTREKTNVTSLIVPVGVKSFTVADASLFKVGDIVGLVRIPNRFWIRALGTQKYGWKASAYHITHYRTITRIHGTNTVTVDIPIVDALDERYCSGILVKAQVPKDPTYDCGVEDLRLEAIYKSENDENHSWNGVSLSGVENCWVRRVTTKHFGYAAAVIQPGCRYNTIEEVASLEPISKPSGGRRYSLCVNGGIGTLFQRCYTQEGRHDFVTGSRVTGPHVWLDCLSDQARADAGPHHRWATGLLLDNCQSALLRVQNRQDSGTGHGWAGAQVLLWNCEATEGQHVDTPPTAMSWTIGSKGPIIDGKYTKGKPRGWLESHDLPIRDPRSLYLQQLKDRLDQAAVEAITTQRQRAGTLFEDLKAWAGNGRLPSE